jgi:hypothetical protein
LPDVDRLEYVQEHKSKGFWGIQFWIALPLPPSSTLAYKGAEATVSKSGAELKGNHCS